eukprot:604090-Pyramimonas_sp.AAC.1
MATFSKRLIEQQAIAMLKVSILMYRAKGIAVLRRAELRCAMPRTCQGDAPRSVPRNAPRDMPGNVPWGRTA